MKPLPPLNSSIRRQLLAWLLIPILFLCLVGAIITYLIAINLATDAYDGTLIESAREIGNRIKLNSSGIYVDLPPEAVAILREDDKDKFYYQVVAPDGHLVAGDTAIPFTRLGDATEDDNERDVKIDGHDVRIVYLKHNILGHAGKWVMIQVAETTIKRQELANEILIAVVLPQLVLILLSALVVWFGVSRGLAPLQMVRDAILRRTQWDLRPVAESGAPREVQPLVDAINDLLERLHKDIEAQRRFVANAAHQLRTPLAGLKMQTELALRVDNPEDLGHALSQIHKSADRATRLVNQLLSLAKFEPANFQVSQLSPVDLNVIAKDAAGELVSSALDKEIDLGFEGCPVTATIDGDAAGLQELISNLIDNAVRYTQKGGKVTVRVVCNGDVSLLVEDNGPGIPEQEREHVFERFYRVLGHSQDGSGLGLAIVAEIAQAHNARISLGQDGQQAGTTVEVIFPSKKN